MPIGVGIAGESTQGDLVLIRVQFQTEDFIGLAAHGRSISLRQRPIRQSKDTLNGQDSRRVETSPWFSVSSVLKSLETTGRHSPTRYHIASARPFPVRAGEAAEKNFNTEDTENHGGARRGPCRLELRFDSPVGTPV